MNIERQILQLQAQRALSKDNEEIERINNTIHLLFDSLRSTGSKVVVTEQPVDNAFGVWLRAQIKDLDMSHEEFGKLLNVGRVTVSNWLTGKCLPHNPTMFDLARAIAKNKEIDLQFVLWEISNKI